MGLRLQPLGEGPVIPLDRPIVFIGRHADCDVRIEHKKISRRHCSIVQLHDKIVIRDLGSTNGVYFNGQRVEEAVLVPQDEVQIANLRYKLELASNGDVNANQNLPPPPDNGGIAKPTAVADDPVPFNELQNPSGEPGKKDENNQ